LCPDYGGAGGSGYGPADGTSEGLRCRRLAGQDRQEKKQHSPQSANWEQHQELSSGFAQLHHDPPHWDQGRSKRAGRRIWLPVPACSLKAFKNNADEIDSGLI
jgi:hypothetical protein